MSILHDRQPTISQLIPSKPPTSNKTQEPERLVRSSRRFVKLTMAISRLLALQIDQYQNVSQIPSNRSITQEEEDLPPLTLPTPIPRPTPLTSLPITSQRPCSDTTSSQRKGSQYSRLRRSVCGLPCGFRRRSGLLWLLLRALWVWEGRREGRGLVVGVVAFAQWVLERLGCWGGFVLMLWM